MLPETIHLVGVLAQTREFFDYIGDLCSLLTQRCELPGQAGAASRRRWYR